MADKKTVNVIFFSNSVDKNVFKLINEGRSAVAQISLINAVFLRLILMGIINSIV